MSVAPANWHTLWPTNWRNPPSPGSLPPPAPRPLPGGGPGRASPGRLPRAPLLPRLPCPPTAPVTGAGRAPQPAAQQPPGGDPPPESAATARGRKEPWGVGPAKHSSTHTLRPLLRECLPKNSSVAQSRLEYRFLLWETAAHGPFCRFPIVSGPVE
jgi:hypothetical protein